MGVQQLGQVLRVTQAGLAEVDAGEAGRLQPDPGPAAVADLDVASVAGVMADEDVLTWQRGEVDGAEIAGVAVVAPVADQVAADQPPSITLRNGTGCPSVRGSGGEFVARSFRSPSAVR